MNKHCTLHASNTAGDRLWCVAARWMQCSWTSSIIYGTHSFKCIREWFSLETHHSRCMLSMRADTKKGPSQASERFDFMHFYRKTEHATQIATKPRAPLPNTKRFLSPCCTVCYNNCSFQPDWQFDTHFRQRILTNLGGPCVAKTSPAAQSLP